MSRVLILICSVVALAVLINAQGTRTAVTSGVPTHNPTSHDTRGSIATQTHQPTHSQTHAQSTTAHSGATGTTVIPTNSTNIHNQTPSNSATGVIVSLVLVSACLAAVGY